MKLILATTLMAAATTACPGSDSFIHAKCNME